MEQRFEEYKETEREGERGKKTATDISNPSSIGQ